MREPKIKIEQISSNDKENVDPNNQAEFQIEWQKYPLSLAANDPNVKDELDSIINKKHECYYITESSNNKQWLIIRRQKAIKSKRFNFENWKSRITNDLDRFRDKHFETYNAHQSDMAKDMWQELNILINDDEYSKRFAVSEENVGKLKKIEIYGLKNDVENLKSKLEETEKNRVKSTVKELKRLSEWQTKYFERFVDYKQLIEEIDDNLKVEISGKKIAIYGGRNSVEEVYEKIEQIIDTIERKELEIEPRSLAEYLKSTDLSKLNQLVEENELKIMLNKSDGSIHMIGTSESDFDEILKQLITSRFSSKKYLIENSLIDLVNSRKFKESVEKKQIELNIPEEERKSMIRITDREIICTGETNLVDELMVHFSAFLDENRIMSFDYTNRYPLETLKYFERVVLEELENEINKGIVDRALQMKRVLELNSSDRNPRLCIRVPFKHFHLVDKYLKLFDRYAYMTIEEDYSLYTALPFSELIVDETEISDAIKSIEMITRCLILPSYAEEIILTDDSVEIECLSVDQIDLSRYDHVINVPIENRQPDAIIRSFLLDLQNLMFKIIGRRKKRLLILFNNKPDNDFHQNHQNKMISYIVNLFTGLSILDEKFELVTFACERNLSITPILDKIVQFKTRPKNPNKPIEAIYPTFVDNQISIIRSTIDSNDDDVTLIGDNRKDYVKKYTIRSDSKVNIEVCKYELRNMIKTEVICNHCFDISNEDLIEQVEEICSNYIVRYKWDFEKLEITVSGKGEKVSKVKTEIEKLAQDFNRSKQAEYFSKQISESVEWQWLENGQWEAFSESLNTELEVKFISCQQTTGDSKIRLLDQQDNCFFEADVKRYQLVYDTDRNTYYQMRRVELLATLSKETHWTSNKNYELVRLDLNSDLYREKQNSVLNNSSGLFNNILGRINQVLSIDRIENRYLFSQYIAEKNLIQDKYGNGFQIEQNPLFHGTSGDSVESICRYGFNRSYAGKNATAFGRGVYFATSSSYSYTFTDIGRGKKVGHMFLCRVLVGTYALGYPNMMVPPPNFDSTTDNPNFPSMFVIYKDAQAYPEYLITFK